MIKDFNQYLLQKTGNNYGVKKIRPRLILEFLEEKFRKPIEFTINIPSSNIGSLTMLEALLINCLLQISSAKKIFEFGTFLGYTTHILAKNSNANSLVYSLDLGPNLENNTFSPESILEDDINNDNYLKELQSKNGAFFLSSLEKQASQKVKLIHENSFFLDIKSLNLTEEIDFIFVDGGHTYENIENDTKLAEQMSRRPTIVVWHDFDSKIHTGVTEYLINRSRNSRIYHVEHSMIAFQLIF